MNSGCASSIFNNKNRFLYMTNLTQTTLNCAERFGEKIEFHQKLNSILSFLAATYGPKIS